MIARIKSLFTSRAPVRLPNERPFTLTLAEWRKDGNLVTEAMKIARTPVFRSMLAVMRNESPSEFVMPMGTQATDRIALQCRIEGYHMALNNLEAMAKPPDEAEDEPVSEFKPENEIFDADEDSE